MPMSEHTIEELSHKVDQLIRHCDNLKQREQQLLEERSRLIEKNEVARTRVEAMIGHLKTLQQNVG
ncbi:MAG: TIGR02449 family protein [Cellvibrionaceae bacterium]